jgi:SAM-dependent methyltransferase
VKVGLKGFLKRSSAVITTARAVRQAKLDHLTTSQRKRLVQRRAIQIEQYLASCSICKLHVGAGRNLLPGWLNTDLEPWSDEIVYLDVTEPFPFEDCVFDYGFNEHMIEHLTYREGLFMLQEFFRVLKPGGEIRIATPNIQNIIGLYVEQKTELQKWYLRRSLTDVIGLCSPTKTDLQRYFPEWDLDHKYVEQFFPDPEEDGVCFVVNNFFRSWGHSFLYDQETLTRLLQSVGFVEVMPRELDESDHEHLCGIEGHGRIVGVEMNRFETMVLEAVRPY